MKILVLLLSITALASDYDNTTMVALGNSFSAGTFANSDGFKPEPQFGIMSAPRDVSWIHKVMFKMTAWPEYSFSTGKKINSHYVKLNKIFNVKMNPVNIAVPGDMVEQVALYQAPQVLGMSEVGYVTIEIGYNDVCRADTPDQMTSVKDFESWLRRAIEIMGVDHKLIVLAPLADITVLPKIIGGRRTLFVIKTETMWKIHKFCPIVTDGLYVKEVRQRIAEYNKVLEKVASEDSVHFAFRKDAANYQPSAQDVSMWDGFHPSKKGHQKMSDLSFPFEKEWEAIQNPKPTK